MLIGSYMLMRKDDSSFHGYARDWHVETNHDICYARSFDNGVTWYKTSGERYELPIKLSNAEYACRLPQNCELIKSDEHEC